MSLPWVCALAAAGFALGPRQRASIFRHAPAPGGTAAIGSPAGGGRAARCPRCARPPAGRLWPVLPVTGRCPACHVRTGPPPLAVEATTAILLGTLAARIHPSLVLAAACWLAICAVPLAFIDAAAHRLPDPLTALAYAGTTALLLLAAATSGQWHSLVRAALGGVALAGLYLVLILISPSGMGLGDAKASASVGSLLAWSGWGILLAGAAAGFLLAAIYGIALLVSGRATRKQHIPFGPFMIAGAFMAALAGTLVSS